MICTNIVKNEVCMLKHVAIDTPFHMVCIIFDASYTLNFFAMNFWAEMSTIYMTLNTKFEGNSSSHFFDTNSLNFT